MRSTIDAGFRPVNPSTCRHLRHRAGDALSARRSTRDGARTRGEGDVVDAARSVAVTVLTVDDQETFRRAARELVAAADGFVHIGEAGSGAEALRMARERDPDLILLDVR